MYIQNNCSEVPCSLKDGQYLPVADLLVDLRCGYEMNLHANFKEVVPILPPIFWRQQISWSYCAPSLRKFESKGQFAMQSVCCSQCSGNASCLVCHWFSVRISPQSLFFFSFFKNFSIRCYLSGLVRGQGQHYIIWLGVSVWVRGQHQGEGLVLGVSIRVIIKGQGLVFG